MEERLSLCPIEDRRRLDSLREGMLEGFLLSNYLLLVDYTGRLFREGKARISAELSAILERLGSSVEAWGCAVRKAGQRPIARSGVRRDSVPPAISGPEPGCAPPGQPGRVHGALRPGETDNPDSRAKLARPIKLPRPAARADRRVGRSQACGRESQNRSSFSPRSGRQPTAFPISTVGDRRLITIPLTSTPPNHTTVAPRGNDARGSFWPQ